MFVLAKRKCWGICVIKCWRASANRPGCFFKVENGRGRMNKTLFNQMLIWTNCFCIILAALLCLVWPTVAEWGVFWLIMPVALIVAIPSDPQPVIQSCHNHFQHVFIICFSHKLNIYAILTIYSYFKIRSYIK